MAASKRKTTQSSLDGSFVFLSYSRKDAAAARKIVEILNKNYVDVFFDENIRFGEDFRARIRDKLESAGCVLVLWSCHSTESDFVLWEAERARELGVLVEAALDTTGIPPPFGIRRNTADLTRWRGGSRHPRVLKLIDALSRKVRSVSNLEREYLLGPPLGSQQVTDAHLALIHTCWRTPQYDEWFDDAEAHRWDIALYGSRQALDRVEEVTYYLHPAYDAPDEQPPSYATNCLSNAHRDTCFRLRQVASGHSLVRADVKIKGQPQPVKLSRYINLFDSAYDIADHRV